ncbi:hypothetical protein SMF913_25031 [Streptomyces malaysiensis]|uniref:Uncharacterized protein n=1 Tax=Streptomyces malaysiensis TaxID=92644 RepID=A0A2J7YNH2_STRMQ|nr:hypothetical protein SMF913_25031 [Streptomyces malaysiensis]
MRYVDLTGSREAAGRSIRLRDMARRLPQLVRRSLALAWQVDRRATVGLLLCQAITGVMQALGLVAISGTLTALLTGGDVYDRLLEAWPSVALLAGAAGVRALLGITINRLSSRLGPLMSREAEQMLLTGCAEAELCAYDDPDFNRAREAADRGAQVTGDLIDEGQDLIASSASFVAGALVLAGVNVMLLPLLIAASLPQALAQVSAARVRYLANLRSNGDLRMLLVLRWHIYTKDAADQIRAGTMSAFLSGRYRETVARINREDRAAADKGACMSLVGALCGGLGSAIVWAAVVLLLANGHISVGHAGTAVFALQTVGSPSAAWWPSAHARCGPGCTWTTGATSWTRLAGSRCAGAHAAPSRRRRSRSSRSPTATRARTTAPCLTSRSPCAAARSPPSSASTARGSRPCPN